METRARYVLIGLFVLLLILSGFGFIYWLNNTGGLGERAIYRIRFEQPVAGLVAGSGVLFNGIRVGSIADLTLDPADPKRLNVTISIDPATPVRADTKVDVTYQGLTGAPAIALIGGSAGAPRLTSANGKPAVLTVAPGTGQNLTDSARQTLRRLDKILDDNAEPLHTAINGISTFADMLGRNSKRIESVLGGLEKMTGGGAAENPPTVFDLAAATSFPPLDKTIKAQLVVPNPSATLVYDTQKILIRSISGAYTSVANAKWADNLPNLMQAKVVRSFENAHQLATVSRPIEQLNAQYRLELGIRNFQISLEPTPTAVVAFSARLVNDKGKVVVARVFNVSVPAESTEASQAVAALNAAFAKAAAELVVWTVGLI